MGFCVLSILVRRESTRGSRAFSDNTLLRKVIAGLFSRNTTLISVMSITFTIFVIVSAAMIAD